MLGSSAVDQLAPPSLVEAMTAPPFVLSPAAMQCDREEHVTWEIVSTLEGRGPSVCQVCPPSPVRTALGGLWPPSARHRLDSTHATASIPEPSGSGVVGVQVACEVTRAPMAHGAPDACPATRHDAAAQDADVKVAVAGAVECTGCQVAPLSREIASTALVGLGSKELPAATHSAGAPQPMALRLPPRNGLG